jgi:hypothetical protein
MLKKITEKSAAASVFAHSKPFVSLETRKMILFATSSPPLFREEMYMLLVRYTLLCPLFGMINIGKYKIHTRTSFHSYSLVALFCTGRFFGESKKNTQYLKTLCTYELSLTLDDDI